MAKKRTKLDDLVEAYGFDTDIEMAEEYVHEGCVPCICMNEGCNSIEEFEPDCRDGYCDFCGANTMQSLLVLMGVI